MNAAAWIRWCLFGLFVATILSCSGGGGGGGGSSPRVLGRVLNVATGGPTNPQSSVQVGSNSVLTAASDGSFSVPAPVGTSSVLVDTQSALGTWTFTFPPITATTDIGDLWVGPEQVTVTGTVLNSTNNAPVPNATVRFAGRSDLTDANGVFVLTNVAYSSQTQTAFWGIAGFVTAAGFDPTEFSTQPHTAISGVVTVTDIVITPTSDPNPPGPPFNIWGRVLPSGDAPGTVATLSQGGNPVRVFNVGSDGLVKFWISPGTYDLHLQKGSLEADVNGIVVTSPNQVVQLGNITLEQQP